jgi:hypothetical protein
MEERIRAGEIGPRLEVDDIQELTDAKLIIPDNIITIELL